MLKEVLKKCIKEEEQFQAIRQKEKKLVNCQTNAYLNRTTRDELPCKTKRTATK
jgi:hypothetical protein